MPEENKQSISIEWIDMNGNKRTFSTEQVDTFGDSFLKKSLNNFIRSIGLDDMIQVHNQNDCNGF